MAKLILHGDGEPVVEVSDGVKRHVINGRVIWGEECSNCGGREILEKYSNQVGKSRVLAEGSVDTDLVLVGFSVAPGTKVGESLVKLSYARIEDFGLPAAFVL